MSAEVVEAATREQFQPLKAEAAMDIEAARNGASWASKVYTASV
jgi:hypothetical protein